MKTTIATIFALISVNLFADTVKLTANQEDKFKDPLSDHDPFGETLILNENNTLTCAHSKYGNYLILRKTNETFKIIGTEECVRVQRSMYENKGNAYQFTLNSCNIVTKVQNLHTPLSSEATLDRVIHSPPHIKIYLD